MRHGHPPRAHIHVSLDTLLNSPVDPFPHTVYSTVALGTVQVPAVVTIAPTPSNTVWTEFERSDCMERTVTRLRIELLRLQHCFDQFALIFQRCTVRPRKVP